MISRIVQFAAGEIPRDCLPMVQRTKMTAEKADIPYHCGQIVPRPGPEPFGQRASISKDLSILRWAKDPNNETVLFVDLDMALLSIPETISGVPAVACDFEVPDFALVYVGNYAWWQALNEEYRIRNLGRSGRGPVYGFGTKLLACHDMAIIPKEHYKHYLFTHNTTAKERQEEEQCTG